LRAPSDANCDGTEVFNSWWTAAATLGLVKAFARRSSRRDRRGPRTASPGRALQDLGGFQASIKVQGSWGWGPGGLARRNSGLRQDTTASHNVPADTATPRTPRRSSGNKCLPHEHRALAWALEEAQSVQAESQPPVLGAPFVRRSRTLSRRKPRPGPRGLERRAN